MDIHCEQEALAQATALIGVGAKIYQGRDAQRTVC